MASNAQTVDASSSIAQFANMPDQVTTHGQSLDSMQSLLYTNTGGGFWGAMEQFLKSGNQLTGFNEHIYNFIYFVLGPFESMLTGICLAIGVILIAFAIYRIREHSVGNASRQKSFIATGFYFVAGALLISFHNFLEMLSVSTFYQFYNYNYSDNVLSYAQGITNGMDPSQVLQQLTFALLLVVGLFSFLRGVFLLIKLGEGGGQESSLSKCIAHLFAGMIGVNAIAAWHVMSYITGVLSGS